MAKTLYVADLDGTLLNESGQLTPYTRQEILRLEAAGGLFTCATGRSLVSAKKVWENLPLRCPVIVATGVSIYSLQENRYLYIESLPRAVLTELDQVLKEESVNGFLYILNQKQEEEMLYNSINHPDAFEYYSSRFPQYERRCCQYSLFAEIPYTSRPLYVTLYGEYRKLIHVYEHLNRIPGIHALFSQRSGDERYYLDIISKACSKGSAILRLKKMIGAEEVVVFGDHLNDLDMFAIADRSYAPENAVDEIKRIATAKIGHCNDDCVAKFISNDFCHSNTISV